MRLDRELSKLLRLCAKKLDAIDAEWAIAGAAAMAAHGYERQTKDIDVFVADDAREELIDYLASRGVTVTHIMPPSHYIIRPPKTLDLDKRIDILFPALGIESLGLMAARRHTIDGQDVPVLQIEHVIALKLQTDPTFDRDRYAKDAQDLQELRARGLIDPHRVRVVLEDVSDQAAIDRLDNLNALEGDLQTPRLRLR
jgi:hypothetical protein